MNTVERVTERPAATPGPEAAGAEAPAPAHRQRDRHLLGPIVSMAAGVAVLALAGSVLTGALRPDPAPVDPQAITLSAQSVSVVGQVYGPGEQSGWHAHAGIHAVAVLAGSLTVYDANCAATTFEPGRPYVGGQELHLVRNETAAPVEMSVTYLAPSHGADPTRRLPPPPGCTAGA